MNPNNAASQQIDGAGSEQTAVNRQSAHTLVFTMVSVCLGFAYNVATARAFGPAGKGLLDLSAATISLFTLVLGLSANTGVTHLVATLGAIPRRLRSTVLAWTAIGCILGASLLFAGRDLCTAWSLLPNDNTQAWAFIAAAGMTLGIISANLRGALVGLGNLVACNRIELVIKATLFLAAAGSLASTYGVLAFPHKPLALYWLATFTSCGQAAAYAWVLRRAPTTAAAARESFANICLPLHGTNLFHFINHRIDVFFVTAVGGTTALGFYALAVSISQLVLLASSAFAQPLLPAVSAARSEPEAIQITASVCRSYLLCTCTAAVVIAVAAPIALPLVFGQGFSASAKPLLILLPGVICFGLTNILISHFVGVGRSRINLVVSIVSAAVTVAGNVLFTLHLGYLAAAWVSSIAYATAAALSILLVARHNPGLITEFLLPRRADLATLRAMLQTFRP